MEEIFRKNEASLNAEKSTVLQQSTHKSWHKQVPQSLVRM